MKLFKLLALFVLMMGLGVGAASAETPLKAPTATTITVTTTTDFAEVDAQIGREDSYTCTYTLSTGAIYKAAPNNVDGSNCTLRRAILEASVRPDSDRPILINFNIPTSDPNYDSTLQIWEVEIDESYVWQILAPNNDNTADDVTVDGGTRPGGGPRIMVNTNRDNNPTGGRSLEIYSADNIIRNIGFHGGGQIILYAGGNLVEGVWMGLTNDGSEMKPASDANSQALRAEARGGIIMPNSASDNNTIRNNRVIGAFERAIRITSGGSGNIIENNFIGMDGNGDIPLNSRTGFDCTRDNDFQANLWYGGEGIQVTGSNNTIRNNTIAGLHKTQSANETPPIAMEIYGTNNDVRGNVIGKDADGTEIGTCGQGLLFGGTESFVTENTFFFTRNGFEPNDVDTEADAVIITQSFVGRGTEDPPRWLKVWNNVIDGGGFAEANYHSYRFGNPGVNEDLRKHIPAKVTSISGTSVSGTNGDKQFGIDPDTDCGSCTVFLYLDDIDNRIEAFELIGEGTFNAAGTTWTGTLDRPLVAGETLRTQNMTNNDTTIISDAVAPIEYYGANTTSRLSDEYYSEVPLAVAVSQQETVSSGQSTVVVFAVLFVISLVGWRVINRPIIAVENTES